MYIYTNRNIVHKGEQTLHSLYNDEISQKAALSQRYTVIYFKQSRPYRELPIIHKYTLPIVLAFHMHQMIPARSEIRDLVGGLCETGDVRGLFIAGVEQVGVRSHCFSFKPLISFRLHIDKKKTQ